MNKQTNLLPILFLNRLQKILSETNYQKYLFSLSEKPATCFRINTLKMDVLSLKQRLEHQGFHLSPISWCLEAWYVPFEERRKLTETIEFKEGLLYIQNPSSMVPTLFLNPQPNEEILDLAAAPGGKTLHLAALIQNKGRIAAVEAVKGRFFRLLNNIKQSGATIIHSYLKDGASIWRYVEKRFDRVLLDAPCSSEARFDPSEPDTYAFWSEKKILEMHRKQKKLLYSAIRCLKSGGTLVYCTCSFAPEENEMVIQAMLDKFPQQLEIAPLELPFPNFQSGLTSWGKEKFSPDLSKAIRIIPDGIMRGFFICKLRKCSS